jgi:hypothetical protein
MDVNAPKTYFFEFYFFKRYQQEKNNWKLQNEHVNEQNASKIYFVNFIVLFWIFGTYF